MAKIVLEVSDMMLGLSVAALKTISKIPVTEPKDIENSVACFQTAKYLEDSNNWLAVTE
jgi:hypothetical protein